MINMVWQERRIIHQDYHLRDQMVQPKNKQWKSLVQQA
jgi:hypothetical protein